jgi:hypothetical protein
MMRHGGRVPTSTVWIRGLSPPMQRCARPARARRAAALRFERSPSDARVARSRDFTRDDGDGGSSVFRLRNRRLATRNTCGELARRGVGSERSFASGYTGCLLSRGRIPALAHRAFRPSAGDRWRVRHGCHGGEFHCLGGCAQQRSCADRLERRSAGAVWRSTHHGHHWRGSASIAVEVAGDARPGSFASCTCSGRRAGTDACGGNARDPRTQWR